MDDARIRSITAISGLAIGLMVVITLPLYFIYDGPPPASNVFTRNLVNLCTAAFLLVFFVGFTHLVRRHGPAYDWLASLIYGSALLFVGMVLVGISLEVGGVFGTPDGTIDPTITGTLANGNILIQGSIKRLLTALMLVPAGYAVRRTRLMPGWLGIAAYLIALFNLAFVPSLYFGKDATQFYSAIGWGNSAFAASFLMYWIIAVSVVLLRQPRQVAG